MKQSDGRRSPRSRWRSAQRRRAPRRSSERVERMERELQELKAELQRRDDADARARGAHADAARHAPAAGRRAGDRAPAAPTGGRADATGTASRRAVAAPFTDRVKLGGYGSIRYEASNLDEQNNTFTLPALRPHRRREHRAAAAARYMELEFERFRKLELEK